MKETIWTPSRGESSAPRYTVMSPNTCGQCLTSNMSMKVINVRVAVPVNSPLPYERFVPIQTDNDRPFTPSNSPRKMIASSPALTAETWTVMTESSSPASFFNKDSHSPSPFSNDPYCSPKRNSDDDPLHKIRVKTELCMHFESGRPCPFGESCTYAHGTEELQLTKLMDLYDAGLVDIETFRIKPCLTWVSTGSCPFGKRCTSIHDARVAGTNSHSWLPHTETQGNTITTDINVDGLHQKRLHSILFDNPFGDQLRLNSKFQELYDLVSGSKPNKRKPNSSRKGRVKDIHKLSIALRLRGNQATWQYNYRPQHIVYDELCMVLQKRAFCRNDDGGVTEIALKDYSPKQASHILVHEIAFGPDSDPSVRGVALWLNIDECNVTVCTAQQAKRFRWKKTGSSTKKKNGLKTLSVFDSGTIDSFPMIRPHDEAAFVLVNDIMRHRLNVIKSERITNMKSRFDALRSLVRQKKKLEQRFDNHRRSWSAWAWPINAGRQTVDNTTPVPAVEGPYEFSDDTDLHDNWGYLDNKSPVNQTRRIWNSFVAIGMSFKATKPLGVSSSSAASQQWRKGGPAKRLRVFEMLAGGVPIAGDRSLPHILKSRATPYVEVKHSSSMLNISRQQERCWKALLLFPCSDLEKNEWDIVRDHFEKSRSKKVLTILQQS